MSPEEVIIPKHPELMIAYGAALSLEELYKEEERTYLPEELAERIEKNRKRRGKRKSEEGGKRFFSSDAEREEFENRHKLPNYEFRKTCTWTNGGRISGN